MSEETVKGKGDTPEEVALRGVKYDSTKLVFDLLPWEGLLEVCKVAVYGASKYAKSNWAKGFEWSRCYNAAQRHQMLWLLGEDIDDESQALHSAAAAWNMLVLASFQIMGYGIDDRHRKLTPEQIQKIKEILSGN